MASPSKGSERSGHARFHDDPDMLDMSTLLELYSKTPASKGSEHLKARRVHYETSDDTSAPSSPDMPTLAMDSATPTSTPGSPIAPTAVASRSPCAATVADGVETSAIGLTIAFASATAPVPAPAESSAQASNGRIHWGAVEVSGRSPYAATVTDDVETPTDVPTTAPSVAIWPTPAESAAQASDSQIHGAATEMPMLERLSRSLLSPAAKRASTGASLVKSSLTRPNSSIAASPGHSEFHLYTLDGSLVRPPNAQASTAGIGVQAHSLARCTQCSGRRTARSNVAQSGAPEGSSAVVSSTPPVETPATRVTPSHALLNALNAPVQSVQQQVQAPASQQLQRCTRCHSIRHHTCQHGAVQSGVAESSSAVVSSNAPAQPATGASTRLLNTLNARVPSVQQSVQTLDLAEANAVALLRRLGYEVLPPSPNVNFSTMAAASNARRAITPGTQPARPRGQENVSLLPFEARGPQVGSSSQHAGRTAPRANAPAQLAARPEDQNSVIIDFDIEFTPQYAPHAQTQWAQHAHAQQAQYVQAERAARAARSSAAMQEPVRPRVQPSQQVPVPRTSGYGAMADNYRGASLSQLSREARALHQDSATLNHFLQSGLGYSGPRNMGLDHYDSLGHYYSLDGYDMMTPYELGAPRKGSYYGYGDPSVRGPSPYDYHY